MSKIDKNKDSLKQNTTNDFKESEVVYANNNKSKRRSRGGRYRNDKPRQASSYAETFDLNRKSSEVITNLDKEAISHLGYNEAGVTVATANLNKLTTAHKLPLIGENYAINPIFQDKLGDDAFISIETTTKLPYVKNVISSYEDLEASAKDLTKLIASMPFTINKTLFHNYKGIKDIVDVDTNLFTYRLYAEDIANMAKTMMDSQGTNFVVANLKIKYGDKNAPKTRLALDYLIYVYDCLMIKAMSVFLHYAAWKNVIFYGEYVTEKRGDFKNRVNGPIFMSSTMQSAIQTYTAALGKFYLPLRYFSTFISPNCTIGKKTSGRITPLEIIQTMINMPEFIDIYGADSNTKYIAKEVFSNLNDELNKLMKFMNPVLLENYYDNVKISALDLRKEFINRWNAASVKLNELYDNLYDLFTGLQRGVQSGLIKCYTNPDDYMGQIAALNNLMTNSELRHDNGTAILGYNYVEQLTTQPLANGTLVTSQFIPEISTLPTVSSDALLMFKGEATLYDPLYETHGDTIITLNQAITNKPNTVDDTVYSLITVKQKEAGQVNQYWDVKLRLNNQEVPFYASHPLFQMIKELITPEGWASVRLDKTIGKVKQTDVQFVHPRSLGRLDYTVNTIGEQVKGIFKYYMFK